MQLEEKVACQLIRHHETLSIAESCSGGLLAHRITNIPGSSKFLKLGLITYSNESKIRFLNIPSATIKRFGAVSHQVAERMAKEVRKLLKTDWGISITGIAGPTGKTLTKPVGLIFIAVSSKIKTLSIRCQFRGTRLQIKRRATSQALKLLLNNLT